MGIGKVCTVNVQEVLINKYISISECSES